jgi:hypothetical protein
LNAVVFVFYSITMLFERWLRHVGAREHSAVVRLYSDYLQTGSPGRSARRRGAATLPPSSLPSLAVRRSCSSPSSTPSTTAPCTSEHFRVAVPC